ncbi:hypothetical protein BAQ49_11080 [Bacillus proteolyticus]|uniref:Uncharacterized protein n=1 Tax=Bacillus proteolyticus TaxID=2026192 RepID=A0AA44KUS3_9BACI|nr:hypothetical protein BAQ49_11080 [Bacillus proteolyticus]
MNVCELLNEDERNVWIFSLLLDERVIVSFSILEDEESSFVFCFVNKVIVQSDVITINELEITNRFLQEIYIYIFL